MVWPVLGASTQRGSDGAGRVAQSSRCQEQNCTRLRRLPQKTSVHCAAAAPVQVRASRERLGLELKQSSQQLQKQMLLLCMLWQLRPFAGTLTANSTKVHIQLSFQPENVNEMDVESDLCPAYLLTSMLAGRTAGEVITTNNRLTVIGASPIQRM